MSGRESGTETLRVDDVHAELLAERDDILDDVATMDEGNPAYPDLVERGATIDTHLDGVEWLRDEYGADATIEVRGLRAGSFAELEDNLHEATGGRTGPGVARNYTVAQGVVAAPFYEDLESTATLEDRLPAVAALPIPVAKWLKQRVDEATAVGGNGRKRFGDLLAEKRQAQTTSTDPSS